MFGEGESDFISLNIVEFMRFIVVLYGYKFKLRLVSKVVYFFIFMGKE